MTSLVIGEKYKQTKKNQQINCNFAREKMFEVYTNLQSTKKHKFTSI